MINTCVRNLSKSKGHLLLWRWWIYQMTTQRS